MPSDPELQQLCERGQELLMLTDYIGAESTLVDAERRAIAADDFDTLARLYMPLQEARRQRRQRCGEGIVKLDLVQMSEDARIDLEQIVSQYPHGQLLVAGWNSLEPAMRLRQLQARRGMYAETLLARAGRSANGSVVITIHPEPDAPDDRCVKIGLADLPRGERRGDASTFAEVMKIWEQLHAPYLRGADAQSDPRDQIQAYRHTIDIDYACELAHQRLSATARELARGRGNA